MLTRSGYTPQTDQVTFWYCWTVAEETAADYGPGSPTRLALDRLAHKWTLLIVWALKAGPMRFTDLRAAVPGVTAQVLTRSLRDLERDGIVARRYFPEVPPRVEYTLTDLGLTMCGPVNAVRAWAEKYADAIQAARAAHDDAS
jgi:DNA-binding HxlR family transcriptional regulator